MADFDSTAIFESYVARLQAGEVIERMELEEKHPALAAELWPRILAWKAIVAALPGTPLPKTSADPKVLAIHFHSAGSLGSAERLLEGDKQPEELALRIKQRGVSIDRYRVVEEIARGAMGAILRVQDTDLDRDLAMKVMLVSGLNAATEGRAPVDRARSASAVARFVEEARITGRLEHPGIPPVHDFGVDSHGNFYFTMLWVRGHTLRDVFRRVSAAEPGWNRTRALRILLKVCDAVAYAHAQGVIHRDLKPRNVMVGEFGEVYVMDWGLARDQSRPDSADIRLATPDAEEDSPVKTRDGVVIGTPCYMSPEQARGDVAHVGPLTDVYALGAILYELLAGHPPYAPSGSKTPAHGVVRQVQNGPPPAVLAERKDVPAELAAICERAMKRDPNKRYASVGALADELRAFADGRVVASYATGAWVELRKWAGRNPVVASLSGALLLVVLLAGWKLNSTERSRREALGRELAVKQREVDLQLASTLLSRADETALLAPDAVAKLEAWLKDAATLEPRLAVYERDYLDFTRDNPSPELEPDPNVKPPFDPAWRGYLEYRREYWIKDLALRTAQLAATTEADMKAQLEHERDILQYELVQLEQLLVDLRWDWTHYRPERWVDKEREPRSRKVEELRATLAHVLDAKGGAIQRVRAHLEQARHVRPFTLEEHAQEWQRALASIADPSQCPLYAGLQLTPQAGLVPLGQNRAGLWEFWHVLSGERPAEREAGAYELAPRSGMVFILVPGGERAVGSQFEDEAGENFCDRNWLASNPLLARDEGPVRHPKLAPYFLSKFEMTQSQWFRLTRNNPSKRFAGTSFTGKQLVSPTHPVEHMSWSNCVDVLRRWNLALPTEAQWEVAARADAVGPFWWGADFPPPAGTINYPGQVTAPQSMQAQMLVVDPLHLPVDMLAPNPWGFFHILGNVSEWCQDWFVQDCYLYEVSPGTGEVLPDYSSTKALRGGSYGSASSGLRIARRRGQKPESLAEDVGVRPIFVRFE